MKGMALDLENIGIKVDKEDRILALMAGLDESYDAFIMSLDTTNSTSFDFDHVVDRLLNEDIQRGSTAGTANLKEEVQDIAMAVNHSGRRQPQVCYRRGKQGHIHAFCTATPLRGKGSAGAEQAAAVAVDSDDSEDWAFSVGNF